MRITAVSPEGPFAALRPGDVLLTVDSEPFFDQRGLEHLHAWLLRELAASTRAYRLEVQRDGQPISLNVELQLGPYVEP